MDQEKSTGRPRRRSSAARSDRGTSNAQDANLSSEKGTAEAEDAQEKPGILSRLIRVATGNNEETRTREDAPNAVDMLKQDHDRVRTLFKQFEETGEGAKATRKRIVERISRELEIHVQLEEKIFYQAFREVSEKDPKKLVRESFEEHKIVKTLVAELAAMGPADPQFEAKVTVLQENVEHHADEEEDELFPAAKKLFDDEKLDELGRRMAEMKAELQRTAA